MAEIRTASDVIGQRVNRLRKQRGWSLQKLADMCAEVGADRLTNNALENIEYGRRDKTSGRRRREVDVAEWLALAYVLDVAPIHLLISPDATDQETFRPVPVAGGSADVIRAWIRGQMPLPGQDVRTYFHEVPAVEWNPPDLSSHRLQDGLNEAFRRITAGKPVPGTTPTEGGGDG